MGSDAITLDGQGRPNRGIAVPSSPSDVGYQTADGDPDDTVPEGSGSIVPGTVLPTPATPAHAFAALANQVLAILSFVGASPAFNGQIVGFAGDGTLLGSDEIDLRGISFTSTATP
jgi:hypothetical protein